jgi:flagellar motor switch protein FliN/FliY
MDDAPATSGPGTASAPAATDGPATAQALSHPFSQVPVDITVSVGKTRPLLRDLLRLGPDAVLPLDSRLEDPVELYLGDRLIARGELQELDGSEAGRLAVRLTEVADLKPEL